MRFFDQFFEVPGAPGSLAASELHKPLPAFLRTSQRQFPRRRPVLRREFGRRRPVRSRASTPVRPFTATEGAEAGEVRDPRSSGEAADEHGGLPVRERGASFAAFAHRRAPPRLRAESSVRPPGSATRAGRVLSVAGAAERAAHEQAERGPARRTSGRVRPGSGARVVTAFYRRRSPGRLTRGAPPARGRAVSGRFGGGDAQHLLDARELHARAPGGLAERALVAVDRLPAVVGDERRAGARAAAPRPRRRRALGGVRGARGRRRCVGARGRRASRRRSPGRPSCSCRSRPTGRA